jgi:hypothetical protein
MARGSRVLLVLALVAASCAQSQAEGVQSFIKADSERTIVAKFLQLADAAPIFGDSPSAGVVLFAATDSAWQTAADKLGINIDPATASKSDGEKLGSLMMYNMISGAGVDVEAEGSPAGLLAKQSVQTLLGAAYNDQLPLTFSAWSEDSSKTVATGLASSNNAVLSEPQKKGMSLVYLTDTVLLPSDSAGDIPIPQQRRR